MKSAMPWRTEHAHWRRMELEFLLPLRPLMSQHMVSLQTLYSRFDSIARWGGPGNSTAAHEAVQDRLAANRAVAETNGWTSFSLERAGGVGPLRLWGIPPSSDDRAVVPDWLPRED
jgi:hypothetical protein